MSKSEIMNSVPQSLFSMRMHFLSPPVNLTKTHQWFNTNALSLLCRLWHWKLQHHVQINYQCLTEQDRTFCREFCWIKNEKNSLKFRQAEFFVWFLFILKFQFTKALVSFKVEKKILRLNFRYGFWSNKKR